MTISGLNAGAKVTFDGAQAPPPVVNLTIGSGGALEIDSGSLEVTGTATIQAASDSGKSAVPAGTLSIVGGKLQVDAGATVLEANRSARQWLGDRAGMQLRLPPGEALRCIFPQDSRGDCGTTEFCPSCVLRRSIEAALSGRPAPRRLAHMIVGAAGQPEDRWFQVSASPLALEGRKLVLVVLEDATQLIELRELLPLCPGCGANREASDPIGQARIFIGQATYERLLREDPALAASCIELPPRELKGFRAAVKVYEVPWRPQGTPLRIEETICGGGGQGISSRGCVAG